MDTALLKLYEYPGVFDRLAEMLEESGGEVTPEIERYEADLNLGFDRKMDAYAAVIKQMDLLVAATDGESRRIRGLLEQRRRDLDNLKRFLIFTIRKLGMEGQRIETPLGRLMVRKNPRPSIDWGWAGDIPAGFRREKVVVELDKEAAHAAHEAGLLPEGFVVVEGFQLRVY